MIYNEHNKNHMLIYHGILTSTCCILPQTGTGNTWLGPEKKRVDSINHAPLSQNSVAIDVTYIRTNNIDIQFVRVYIYITVYLDP